MHEKKIIHKDLKPLNILLKKNKSGSLSGSVGTKIANFGISKIKQTDNDFSLTSGITGTIRYLPLEFLKSQVFGYFTDVYAFRVILFEILYEKTPWKECKTTDDIIVMMEKGVSLAPTKKIGSE
jgi:serine/threonine protein kinase